MNRAILYTKHIPVVKEWALRILFWLMLAAICIRLNAQHNNELVVKGCSLAIQPGANLVVQGDFLIEGVDAQLRNNGYFELQGNMYSDTLFQQRGTGTTRMYNRSVNTNETQFISGSYAVRGGTSQIGVNDGSFYSLDLANRKGVVWLNGTGNVADVRNMVNFSLPLTGAPINRIVTHNPDSIPWIGSDYSAVFGMMNAMPGIGTFLNNSVSSGGPNTVTDKGYIQGKLRRAIAPTGGTYGFVIGTEPGVSPTDSRGIQYSQITFAANTYDVFTGAFDPFSQNVVLGNPHECGYDIQYFSGWDHGEWFFQAPENGSGLYSLRIWPQNYFFSPQQTFLLTQNDSIKGTPGTCGVSATALSRSGFSGSGLFGFAGGGGILSSDQLQLAASAKDNSAIELNWRHPGASGIAKYEIERAGENMEFATLGKQTPADSISHSGNSYVQLDSEVQTETKYFYRVKATGIDGSIQYSNTAEAILHSNPENENKLTVYPNPVRGGEVNFLWETSESEKAQVSVYDYCGKLIASGELQTEPGTNKWEMNTNSWSAGMYFISISGSVNKVGKFRVE